MWPALENTIMAKVAVAAPHLFQTKIYQTGFKEGTSTATHISRVLTLIHHGQRKKRWNYSALIYLQKAYETVNREKIWKILDRLCVNGIDGMLALLMVKMYQKS
jgi:hypothetical protein